MHHTLHVLMANQGQSFQVERNGAIIATLQGLANREKATNLKYIGFYPDYDIVAGDWVINSVNERFFVKDTSTAYFQSQPHQLKAYYLTEVEFNSTKAPTASAVFNIGTAYGSVIGTQSGVVLNYNDCIADLKSKVNESTSEDKEQLDQIVKLLEMVVNDHVPVSKGLFSKFSAVMERNSWITSSVASAIFSWLTTLCS